MTSVEGKVALVTGAGSGIGRATCRRLAEEGAEVVVTSRTSEHVERVADEVEDACGRRPLAFALDVGEAESVAAGIGRVVERHGRIDILSHNAGIQLPNSPSVIEATDEEWDRVLRINLTGCFWVCREALPHMAQGGAIVNMASVSALFVWPGEALYETSKAGMLQLTRALALEAAPQGVRVNCVCPGTVDTPLLAPFLEQAEDPDALRREFAAAAPLGRLATPREIADCVLFLASDEASFVTGAALVADGGATLSP